MYTANSCFSLMYPWPWLYSIVNSFVSATSIESQSTPGIKMVYPKPCKESQRRKSAPIHGWHCPLHPTAKVLAFFVFCSKVCSLPVKTTPRIVLAGSLQLSLPHWHTAPKCLLKLLCLSTTTDAIPMAHRILQST